ncbi:MAG TPA: ATPase, T2SS/T4P/T4SS family, partial [Vampirovibrionales bacterium]
MNTQDGVAPVDADFASIFFKPIAHYLNDPDVSEIMVNAHNDIWIEDSNGLHKVAEIFTQDSLVSAVNSLAQYVGRPLQENVFSIDARMPDGSRVCIVLPPVSGADPAFAIRKFKEVVSDLDFLVQKKSLAPEMVELIDALVNIKKNMLVSGGTSSGKTTLLNLIAAKIPDTDRIVTIEDSRELQLKQEHVLGLEGKPADKHGKGAFTIRQCLKSTLRLRPDRIVVGEVRGGEAFDLIQAMNTGHAGCMSTIHANTPTDTLRRVESLALTADVDIPLIALRSMISSALDVIICPARLSDGSRRVVQIAEVGLITPDGNYHCDDICKFVSVKRNKQDGKIQGYFEFSGHVPSFFDMFEAEGLNVPREFFRKRVIGDIPEEIVPLIEDKGYDISNSSTIHKEEAQIHHIPTPTPIEEPPKEETAPVQETIAPHETVQEEIKLEPEKNNSLDQDFHRGEETTLNKTNVNNLEEDASQFSQAALAAASSSSLLSQEPKEQAPVSNNNSHIKEEFDSETFIEQERAQDKEEISVPQQTMKP